MLYFAYGSNLASDKMRELCAEADFLGLAILPNFRLAYRGALNEVYLTLLPEQNAYVEVGVWQLPETVNLAKLDAYEDYPEVYQKQTVTVKDGRSGFVYLMNEQFAAQVHQIEPAYQQLCEQAAKARKIALAPYYAAANELHALLDCQSCNQKALAIKLTDVSYAYDLDNEDAHAFSESAANEISSEEEQNLTSDGSSFATAKATALVATPSKASIESKESSNKQAPVTKIAQTVRKMAISDLNLQIKDGTYTCIIGQNGSGKSTLVRLFNALLLPLKGQVEVYGIDSQDDKQLYELRRRCGMVFQNPDNQIIGTTVEEDMAFGPENLGIPALEIRQRINAVLKLLKMEALRQAQPQYLSGGQKQKLAIAGILVMNPLALLLDEATSMLDPQMRADLLAFIAMLRRQRQLTVVNVTHHLDEVMQADRVLVLAAGRLLRDYTPNELFADWDLVNELEMRLPASLALWHCLLQAKGLRPYPLKDLSIAAINAELANLLLSFTTADFQRLQVIQADLEAKKAANLERLAALIEPLKAQLESFDLKAKQANLSTNQKTSLKSRLAKLWPFNQVSDEPSAQLNAPINADVNAQTNNASHKNNDAPQAKAISPLIEVKNLNYAYDNLDGRSNLVLENINFQVQRGEILAIVGHSGSGKSTLVMQLNGLLKPNQGQVLVNGLDVHLPQQRLAIRQKVALLFQYPEQQLFAETVYEDIAYGPKKLGYTPAAIAEAVKVASQIVGFDESILKKSPFELSGGQMRRVAFAGIIAMQPEVFVLDEPAAGLDDKGRQEIFSYIKLLKKLGKTIIVVSHNMQDVAEFADRVLVLKGGKIQALAEPECIFTDRELLAANNLAAPDLTACLSALRDLTKWPIQTYASDLVASLQQINLARQKVLNHTELSQKVLNHKELNQNVLNQTAIATTIKKVDTTLPAITKLAAEEDQA